MMVIDASAVLELLLRRSLAGKIEEHLDDVKVICAPHLLDLEVTQVMRRYCLIRELSFQRGQEALRDFQDLGIVRYPHGSLLERIWELRDNMTAYDAAYVALAESLSAPLLTCDERLKNASRALVEIELL